VVCPLKYLAPTLCKHNFTLASLPVGFVHAEKQKVAVIVDQVSKKAAEIGAVKDDAEKDLSAAQPALDAALEALASINQKDIVSLKALKNPPDIVKRIFDCVLLLRYWPIDKVGKASYRGHSVWFAATAWAAGLLSSSMAMCNSSLTQSGAAALRAGGLD
jgi:hypothetical protein